MLQRSDRTTASFYDPNHNKSDFFFEIPKKLFRITL